MVLLNEIFKMIIVYIGNVQNIQLRAFAGTPGNF